MESVVVTGLGVVSAIGTDVDEFTQALREGRSGVQVVEEPIAVTDSPVSLMAPIGDFDLDRALYTYPKLAGETRDRALAAAYRSPLPIQAALAAAAEAWQAADLDLRPISGERIGIVVGGHNLTNAYAFEHYETYRREPAHLPARYAFQVMDTDHVGTISHALGITGEGYTVGAASASGNAAIMQAARLISCGAVDVCLAVGAMSRLDPIEREAFAKLGVLADPDDDPRVRDGPRPFDRSRSGFVPGEATACMVLESRTAARRRGVVALVELAGYAQALDGNSLTNPSVEGETRAMRAALAMADAVASDVDYVNAHATATPAGDDTELQALRAILGEARPLVNSTKSLIGHTLSAAGVIEALATVVQMRHGFVHPNPTLVRPVDAKYRLVGKKCMPARIRLALSNSFGFGGFNSSLVLRRR
jgi:malonyl-ACP decarboxylase